MDVGYFISELLGQHGEVNVPGLGYFAHTRVNGYYNDSEGKFYPPGYNVQFDPRFVEDDVLAQSIAQSRNISVASARYFTEKYVVNIKQQAIGAEMPLGEVGWFYMQGGALSFRSNNNLNTDPEFFGLPAITLHKKGAKPAQVAPLEDVPVPDANTPQFETDQEHEAFLIDHTRKRRTKTVWAFVILAILLGGLFAFLYSKYDRSAFNLDKNLSTKDTVVKVKPKKPTTVLVVDSASTDSADDDKIIIAKKGGRVDSVSTAPKDTAVITGPRFEILGGSFATVQQANIAIANYKRLGFTAHILDNVPGRKRKVTLGTYKTKSEAIAAQNKILATGKIRSANMYIQPYTK